MRMAKAKLLDVAWLLAIAGAFAFAVYLVVVPARGEPVSPYPCPTEAPCKVLVLSDQDEKLLLGIIELAEWASQRQMFGVASALRAALHNAPAGTPMPKKE